MVFSSTVFLFLFLPIVLLVYYIINPKFRNVFLLISSIFFYGWGEPKFIVIMFISIMVNYFFGLLVDIYRMNKKVSYFLIGLMVFYNVSVFFIYKYLNFTIENLNNLFGNRITQTNILLPIGISFFTFQAMSYVIDVYRGNGKVQKNPLNVALYIMFFPQLIAGPIVRYETISDALNNRKENFDDLAEGIKRFIIGLGKKCIISNSVAIIADQAFSYSDLSQVSVLMAWLGAISYSLQIFFDFSGYSDMAIGLGKMFGFKFEENFNYPYISNTISEFWRRWHISLGTWFRDYVYFPLGGSRVKKNRLLLNLFIVWLLTGIWHGASWTFVVWGLFYFILLTFEKIVEINRILNNKFFSIMYRIFTLLCILIGWIIFRSNSLGYSVNYIRCLFGLNNNPLSNNISMFLVIDNFIFLLIAIILCTPLTIKLKKIINTYVITNKLMSFVQPIYYIVLFIISISYILNSSYNPFIYFNF